jgi:hypothetical protein
MNAYEARLLGVERGLMGLGRQAGELQRDTWAGLQAARELWQEIPPGAPCNGTIVVTIKDPTGAVIQNAGVAFSGGLPSGRTGTDGKYTATITAAGSYTITATAGCYSGGNTATITAVCAQNDVTIQFTTGTAAKVNLTINGCNGNRLPNATITATFGGHAYSWTASAGGTVTADLSADATGSVSGCTFTASDPLGRLASASGSTNVQCGATNVLTINLTSPAASYHCGTGCGEPLKDALTLIDPTGTVTLTYNTGTANWRGNQTVNGQAVTWVYSGVGLSYIYGGVTHFATTGTRTCPPALLSNFTVTDATLAYSSAAVTVAEPP